MSDPTTPPVCNVCSEVVAHDLCIGCGMCAGICPERTLAIGFNEFGEYTCRDAKNACVATCDLCLRVCPFWCDQTDNEDTLARQRFGGVAGIEHHAEVGYHLEARVGYSNGRRHRANGASGGLATWTLEALLAERWVDRVCCVRPTGERDRLFEFAVCDSPEQVQACSRSCYYPVETSRIVQHILDNKSRYAVIAQPCYLKAFRLAMQAHPKLRDRVTVLLGLVCGQAKSRFFAEYACALGGGNPGGLDEVVFRVKDPRRAAWDYGMKFASDVGTDEAREGTIYWSEGMDSAWFARLFTPNACSYCDDAFCELGDAAFMDAWLDEYAGDPSGTSLMIVRSPVLRELFDRGERNGELRLDPIAMDRVIESQRGPLKFKRWDLPKRLARTIRTGRRAPAKRVKPALRLTWLNRFLLSAMARTTACSKEAFLAQRKRGPGLAVFRRAMLAGQWYYYLVKIIVGLDRIKKGRNPCA